MASLIADNWVYATVLIRNDWNDQGSGFLVAREIDPPNAKIFVVTNKHVLNKDPSLRNDATEITLFMNVQKEDGGLGPIKVTLPLSYESGTKRWKEHPDPDTDVLAIDATQVFASVPDIFERLPSYDIFADAAKLDEFDVTIADDILVIGYPAGITQGEAHFPLVRSGIIATNIGSSYSDIVDDSGSERPRTIRGFLIDGATIHGSSGSPVVLKPAPFRLVKGHLDIKIPPPLLLGIVAETLYTPLRVGQWSRRSFTGLGLAFDAETVRECIEMFFDR